jgi:phosphoribosylformimino-5-aminoimidazole carboxamide ribotide isomerase
VIVLPAIDLKDGKAVRLLRGEMEKATVYSDSPAEVARRWQDAGATHLHVVDLDGAMQGEPRNRKAIDAILAAVRMKVEVGGGIRTEEAVKGYLGQGLWRVILGTAACADPKWASWTFARFPGQVAAGIDAREGLVAVKGWVETTATRALDLATGLGHAGAAHIVYTDISRDGALTGPNFAQTAEIARAAQVPVVLSGGMKSQDDVLRAAELEPDGVRGVILGRSLYEKTIDLAAAVRAVQGEGDAL